MHYIVPTGDAKKVEIEKFLSDPGPITVYPCQPLTDGLVED